MNAFGKSIMAAVLVFSLGATAALQTGCSSTATRRSTGEYVDDVAITARVKAAFAKDDLVKAREVGVTTNSGVVQLSGFVASQAEKDHAARLARSIADVRDVKNDVIVR